MTQIITAHYGASTTITNLLEDLAATGIPREKIRIDEEQGQVQVATADSASPEITEILQRHQPTDLRTEAAD